MIKKLPIAPSSDRPYSFNDEADKFVSALQPMCDDINSAIAHINTQKQELDTSKEELDEALADFSTKCDDFTIKYDNFSPKYDDFASKYTDFVPKYEEVINLQAYFDNTKLDIDNALIEAKNYINKNNNVIDDTKISEVSTYSSFKIEAKFDNQVTNSLSFLYDAIIKNRLEFIENIVATISHNIGSMSNEIDTTGKRIARTDAIFDKFEHYVLYKRTIKKDLVINDETTNYQLKNKDSNLLYINTGVINDK